MLPISTTLALLVQIETHTYKNIYGIVFSTEHNNKLKLNNRFSYIKGMIIDKISFKIIIAFPFCWLHPSIGKRRTTPVFR